MVSAREYCWPRDAFAHGPALRKRSFIMSVTLQLVTIGICALATMATRYLPFLIFSDDQHTPGVITYLGKALPAAIFSMLVVYCLKGVSLTGGTHGIPEAIAILFIVILHMWKRNMMLSIAGGTILYMLLVQTIF